MENEVRYDVDGFDAVTNAILYLLNSYPLGEGDFQFATLDESGGRAMFPTSGAIIREERESITGHVFQRCLYPFNIYYRAAGLNERRKIAVKEWLDTLGRWLERQIVVDKGVAYSLELYPALNDGRKIESISRTTPAGLANISANQTQDWVINMQLAYTVEFDRR